MPLFALGYEKSIKNVLLIFQQILLQEIPLNISSDDPSKINITIKQSGSAAAMGIICRFYLPELKSSIPDKEGNLSFNQQALKQLFDSKLPSENNFFNQYEIKNIMVTIAMKIAEKQHTKQAVTKWLHENLFPNNLIFHERISDYRESEDFKYDNIGFPIIEFAKTVIEQYDILQTTSTLPTTFPPPPETIVTILKNHLNNLALCQTAYAESVSSEMMDTTQLSNGDKKLYETRQIHKTYNAKVDIAVKIKCALANYLEDTSNSGEKVYKILNEQLGSQKITDIATTKVKKSSRQQQQLS